MDVETERFNPDAYSRRGGAEKEARLPGLNDPYQAAGTQENNEVARLVLIKGKDGFKTGGTAYHFLQYVHIGVGEFRFTASGQVFSFVVSDLQPKRVTVHGRNLLRICDYIALRRQPWIREADRDFRPLDGVPDDTPIITRIEIEDWQPPSQDAKEEQAVA